MDDAMMACLPKASDLGDVPSLDEQGKSRMSTRIGMSKEVTGIARQAVGAQTAQRRAQFAQQLDPARVALRVDVAVDVVCINNRTDPLKLVDHLVDATREQRQLNVVDEQRRGFVDKRARMLTA